MKQTLEVIVERIYVSDFTNYLTKFKNCNLVTLDVSEFNVANITVEGDQSTNNLILLLSENLETMCRANYTHILTKLEDEFDDNELNDIVVKNGFSDINHLIIYHYKPQYTICDYSCIIYDYLG